MAHAHNHGAGDLDVLVASVPISTALAAAVLGSQTESVAVDVDP